MFHISSPYFFPPFLPFFSEFSKCQNLKLFPSQADRCLQAHWEGQDFLLQWILPLQKYVNQLHCFCVNRSMASVVWHTNAFILSGYKGIWCRVFFFVATPERNATATILLLPCRLIQTASSNRLDQRGSTKLARHQQSLLLRVRLVGEQKAIAIRPWSHTSVPTVNRKAIYLESNVKWQNMTKDYIISISSGHRCAAVDLSISILLLPPAVLHNQANKFTTGQSTVCDRKSET